MTSTIHSSISNEVYTDYTSLYSQYLQNQQHFISSIFNSSMASLEHKIVSNILKTLESDQSRKENIMMITLCQMAQKIHCNGTLIQNILSQDQKQQDQCNQTHEYLNQILSTLNKTQNRKLNALESKIYDVEIQLKSHTKILENIYDEIKHSNTHNPETKPNEMSPTQYEKIMNKIHYMDKKIDTIKSKQIKAKKK
eukprot:141879_1